MTHREIEQFVIDKGSPQVLTLHPDDWQKVYEVYRATNRDQRGVFVLVINTRIYSSVLPAAAEIDLSKKRLFKKGDKK